MKKILKNPIFTFVLGGIIVASIVGVYAITADSISYNDTTVKEAIDDLYTTKNTTISNLENKVNSYESDLNTAFRIRSKSTTLSYAESQYFLSHWKRYFKYVVVTNIEPENTSTDQCYVSIWSDEQSKSFAVTTGEYYEIYSSTDGYKYTVMVANTKSKTEGTLAACKIYLKFTNIPPTSN